MISIVIPNFNSGKILKKNLPQLFELLEKTGLEYEVIVTDDASTDDSVDILESTKAKVIQNDVNTGFGSNVDRGIRVASGDIVFILNAIDLMPQDESYFEFMLAHFENPKVFSVGAIKQDVQNHGSGEIYFDKGYFLHRRSDGPKKLSAWSDGGSQAIRKDYYFKIGGFDPIYKFYWEDVDLGYRAWKAGYEVHFEQRAVLIHKKEEGPIAKFYSERETRIMNLRNQMIFTWKNSDWCYLVVCTFYTLYYIFLIIKNKDFDWIKAYFQAISHFSEIFKRRWVQKKVAKISDQELLKKFSS